MKVRELIELLEMEDMVGLGEENEVRVLNPDNESVPIIGAEIDEFGRIVLQVTSCE